jgi:hypothetical protein
MVRVAVLLPKPEPPPWGAARASTAVLANDFCGVGGVFGGALSSEWLDT